MSRRALGLILAALAFGAVLWLWPRGPKDPEAQVRQRIAELVASVERKELGVLSDALDDGFKGPQGTSKQEVKQLIAGQVLRNQELVSIFNPSLEVKLRSSEDADIEGVFLFARTKAKSVDELEPGAVASAYRITGNLTRYSGEWRFVSATYQQISWP